MLRLTTSSFWRNIHPTGALADFKAVFHQAGRNRWRIAALAAFSTFAVFSLIIHEEAQGPPRPPHIVYITSYAPGRTDAQIEAEIIANQKVKDHLAIEQQKRDAEVKGIYKAVGRASGFDVETMDRQGQADEAADAKAAAAKQAALYGAGHLVSAHP